MHICNLLQFCEHGSHIVGTGLWFVNPLNAELNPICHLLELLGAHHILHFSRIRVNNCLQC